MSNVLTVDESNFESEVINSKEPVVIDFWAEWCQPCKMLSPVLTKVASKYQGKIKVVKCNVDENANIAARYAIYSIPNLLFLKDGIIVGHSVGYVGEVELSKKIEEVVGLA